MIKSFFRIFNVTIEFNKPDYWAERILDFDFGHNTSNLESSAMDKGGEPIPWYTYPAIEFINQLDLSGRKVFEWGSGNSSLYYAQHAREVISIESDRSWHDVIKNKTLKNGSVIYQDETTYCDAIKGYSSKFDLIVIDGINRNQCAEVAPDFLKKSGMIILDNSDWHPGAVRSLNQANLIQIDFNGFGPINKYSWTTSMFLSREFDILRRKDFETPIPVGGLEKKN